MGTDGTFPISPSLDKKLGTVPSVPGFVLSPVLSRFCLSRFCPLTRFWGTDGFVSFLVQPTTLEVKIPARSQRTAGGSIPITCRLLVRRRPAVDGPGNSAGTGSPHGAIRRSPIAGGWDRKAGLCPSLGRSRNYR